MRYRSQIDIICNTLEAAKGGVSKTKLMYKTFLAFNQVRDYLALLTEHGLIESDSERQLYRTTPKGLKFVDSYYRLVEVMGETPPNREFWPKQCTSILVILSSIATSVFNGYQVFV